MKALLDFLPLVLFFAAYKLQDIYVATGVLMAATAAQMAWIYFSEGKLQTLHKVTLTLVLGFGAATLALHDERFIKWKPTVLYVLLALGLLGALWIWKRNVLQTLLGSQLELPVPVWHRLNLAWVGYSLFMAAINAYVVVYYSTEAWVSFKLWGYVFPILFLIGQGVYVARHLKEESSSSDQTP